MGPKQLYLHTSNRMENLAARLVEVTQAQPLSSLLSQETVMTLNPGIARWLRFDVARHTGVSFGWHFPLPGKLYAQLMQGLDKKFDDHGRFDEAKATWLLNRILANLEDKPRFELVRAYCASNAPTRRFAFAARLARLYDEYLIYRPEQIINWEDAPIAGYDWQGEIWRRLARAHFPKQTQPPHIARLWHRLHKVDTASLPENFDDWPERLFVFGVSSLAPIYLDFLNHLSHFRPVHIFLLQPSNLYWADLKTSKEIAKIVLQKPVTRENDEVFPEDWIHDTGNPLLPSLGKQGQVFLDLIIDRDPIQDDFAFEEPNPETQIGALQNDLFNIVDRSTTSAQPDASPFPSFDGTLQFHSASSRRREVEALWDHLVDRLEKSPDLNASEILVMAPDIQAYASHIEAVFASKRGTSLEMPFSVADRSTHRISPVLSGLAALLDAPTDRASSKEILSLLERPLFREVFRFSDRDLDAIGFWIRELGITWGWDAAHRKQHGAFATDRNTWRELENRLAAGLCLGSENRFDPGHRFPPFPELEGELSATAGRFLECLQLLNEVRESQSLNDSIDGWQKRILALFERLKSTNDDWSQDYRSASTLVLETIPSLSETTTASGAEIYQALSEKLEQVPSRSGYLSGGITFCSLKPMRAIPAQTICLIGMNYADFPRKTTRLSFDLLAQKNRRGDRNTRDEDRQFFLETLLSARQSLYISYLGMSPSDDTVKEPATVVSDLQSYLKKALPENEYAQLSFQHQRQSYAPHYFANDRFFTYDPIRSSLYNAFTAPTASPSSAPSLSESPQGAAPKALLLEELISFFQDPSRYFVQNSLQAKIARTQDDIEEMDTLSFDPLNRYFFRQDIVNRLRDSQDLSQIKSQEIQSEKWLPPGHLETITLREQLALVEPIASFLEQRFSSRPIEPTRLRFNVSGIAFSGTLETHRGSLDQTLVSPGSWNGPRYMEIWIRHLAASVYAQTLSLPSPTFTAVSLDPKSKPFTLSPPENPLALLEDLTQIFLDGLSAPIPLFPKLNRLAFEAWKKPSRKNAGLKDQHLEAAVQQDFAHRLQTAQTGSPYTRAFDWTDYDAICFGYLFPLPASYLEAARSLWTPFEHVKTDLKVADLGKTSSEP